MLKIVLCLASLLLATSAEAKIHRHHERQVVQHQSIYWATVAGPKHKTRPVRYAGRAPTFQFALGAGLAHMIGARPALSADCRSAAAQGGPCGCFTSEHFGLPRAYHGLNLWLANDWLRLPHTSPAAGTAAVWPGRHVAPVVGVNEDGTVTISDNIGTRRVRSAGLVFVSPR